MEEIDKIYLSRALKFVRSAEAEIKRIDKNEVEAVRLKFEIERIVQKIALLLAKVTI